MRMRAIRVFSPQTWRLALFCSIGAASGIILWGVAWVVAAGGHGSGLMFTLFFPWSEFLYRIDAFAGNTWLLTLISFLQMPLYALVIGIGWDKGHRTTALVAVTALHIIAVAGCHLPHRFYETFW